VEVVSFEKPILRNTVLDDFQKIEFLSLFSTRVTVFHIKNAKTVEQWLNEQNLIVFKVYMDFGEVFLSIEYVNQNNGNAV